MTDELKRHLGAVVRAARKRAGLTQEELAARVSRTPESISNIGRGVQLPTIETIADLGRVLDVPLPDFFAGLRKGKAASPERVRLEAELREASRLLSDIDLAVAVAQVSAFLAKKGR